MRYPHLAARVFNTPLLIHPQKLDAIIAGLGPRLLGLGEDQRLLAADTAPEMFSTRKGERNKERGYRVVDGVAVVGINGALVHKSRMEADSSFLLGYNDIAADVEHAMDNSDVHAVLQVYDSPGGEVQGAFEYAARMLDLRGKKPMQAIADGMAASAAYLGGSAADQLAITSTGYAGSIGVVMRHVDFSRALANDGISVTHIFAGAHKVDGHPFAPLPEAVRAEYQAEINDLYAMFAEAVAKHTGLSIEAIRQTEAATYRGQAAVAAGLAARVSTTDHLIAELAALRSSRSYGLPARATAQRGEKSMSDPTKPAGDNLQPATFTQADVDRAKAEGTQAGAQAERVRVQAILTSAEAEGRTQMAQHLAFSTGMSADDAKGLLATAPVVIPLAATSTPGAEFAAAMAGVQNPAVGADAPSDPNPAASQAAGWDRAFTKTAGALRAVK